MEVVSGTLQYVLDVFHYMFVVVSWNLSQFWTRLGKRSEDVTEEPQTPQNKKTFTPIMRSARPSSSRRIASEYPAPVRYKPTYRKPAPLHLSRNLFGSGHSPDMDLDWDPNRTMFISYYKYDYARDNMPFQPL